MSVLFKKIFAVEGNIGAGKTTLLKLLEKEIPKCKILYEPVDDWKNLGGEDLLKAFYADPKRWCFSFEMESMVSKLNKLKEALKEDYDIIIMERSLFSDKAFQRASFLLDKLSNMEMVILDGARDLFFKDYPNLSGVIYIDTDVEVCLGRIFSRGRSEEKDIDTSYLSKLEDLFLSMKYGCPMMMMDGNYKMDETQKIVKMIKKFINKCL